MYAKLRGWWYWWCAAWHADLAAFYTRDWDVPALEYHRRKAEEYRTKRKFLTSPYLRRR